MKSYSLYFTNFLKSIWATSQISRADLWKILKNFWECQESNPGQLGEKHKSYLCALLPLSLLSLIKHNTCINRRGLKRTICQIRLILSKENEDIKIVLFGLGRVKFIFILTSLSLIGVMEWFGVEFKVNER